MSNRKSNWLERARELRMGGFKYEVIEEILFTESYRDHNGKRIHNAAISKTLVDKYPELRRRKPNKRKEVVKDTGDDYKKKRVKTINLNLNLVNAYEEHTGRAVTAEEFRALMK